MFNRRKSWNEIQPETGRALRSIQEGFTELFRSDATREGWGQYIDPPAHRNHTGIYGTGSGIQISSMSDSDSQQQRIKTAQEWLIDQWSRDDSVTAEQGYKHLTYKHIFCLFGLSNRDTAFTAGRTEYDSQYSDNVDDIFTSLWNKRIEDVGWGKYWLESDPDEMDLQCSALSALALLSHEEIRRTPEYEEILKKIGKRAYQKGKSINRQNIGNGNRIMLTIAFCLLALSRYRHVVGNDNIDKQTGRRINQLGKIITKNVHSGSNIDMDTYSISLISLPDSGELPDDANKEHYMIFLVYPVVALALLEAGSPFVGRNHLFIRNIVEQYMDAVLGSDKGCFSSSDTSRCSTHDHLWIAELLHRFRQIDIREESWHSRVRGHLRSKYLVSFVSILSLSTLVVLAAVYAQPENSVWVRAVANMVIALSGALLGGLKPVLDFRDYLHHKFSSLL